MKDEMFYWNDTIGKIGKMDSIVIYGAGAMGKALKKCLGEEPYNKKVSAFIVKDMEGNPQEIEGVPVMDIMHAGKYKSTSVLAALHEKYIDAAVGELKEQGFSNVIPVTFDGDEWSDIRGNWFRQQARQGVFNKDLEECPGEGSGIRIYVACSASDRKLEEKIPLCRYEVLIQAGAALSAQVLSQVRDNTGVNISEKNRKFCELTALYWIWKNDRSVYAGLCHYRRRFVLDEDMISRLVYSGIDAVLTVPIINVSGVRRQYSADHDARDWDIMMEAIRLMCPEYMRTAEEVQDGIFYYAYNMFIARREVLDKYCGWLFPLLFYCEERIGDKEDRYQNRYIGFLAERLLTIFFVHNREKYRVAVARKHFIGTENGEKRKHEK